jgi:hypothetical protein
MPVPRQGREFHDYSSSKAGLTNVGDVESSAFRQLRETTAIQNPSCVMSFRGAKESPLIA